MWSRYICEKHWDSWYDTQGKDLITEEEKKYLPFVNYIKMIRI